MHSVRNLRDDEAAVVVFSSKEYHATVVFEDPERMPVDGNFPWPDLALLDLGSDVGPTGAVFDANVPLPGTRVQAYGFPYIGERDGEETSPMYEGRSNVDILNDQFRLKLQQSQIDRGMSGAPLYLGDPPVVIGIITATRGRDTDLGGFATPALHIVRRLAPHVRVEVRNLQEVVSTAPQSIEQFPATTSPPTAVSLAGGPGVRPSPPTAGLETGTNEIITLIDRADAMRRLARPTDAIRLASLAVEHPRIATAPVAVRARALRALAVALAERNQDLPRARQLAQDAQTIDADPVQVARVNAIIAYSDVGPGPAIASLPRDLSPELDALRAGYMVESGDISGAHVDLERLPTTEAEKPHVRRLRAIVAVLQHQRGEALRLAEGLVVAASEDIHIAFTVMVAFVLGSVPVHLWPARILGWPEPIPGTERLDDPAQPARLRMAADLALRVLRESELDSGERGIIAVWRLAGLALDPGCQTEAESYARELLEGDVPNYRVLAWVWTTPLQVDTHPALEALRRRADSGEASAEELITLTVAALRDDDGVGAEQILRAHEAVFADAPARSKRNRFLVNALVLQNRINDAAELLDGVTEPEDRRVAELMLVERTGDEAGSLARVRALWERSHDPIALLVAAEIALRHRDWMFLADHGQKLLATFSNTNSARLAMYGAFNTQRYSEVLERYAEFVATGLEIPADLLRVRALSLERIGDPETPAAFNDLLSVAPTDANYYSAGYARLRRGDLAGVAALGQQIEGLHDLTAATAFAFASWVRPLNPDLARLLWRRGMALGLPADDLVLLAFDLGHNLGMGVEMAPLKEPMERLGAEDRAGIRLVTQEQALELQREQTQRSADLFSQYRRGLLPVHLLCVGTNLDLVRTHVEQPRENRTLPGLKWTPMFVRHGGRTTTEDLLADRATPIMDATSFLLAADLEVLNELHSEYPVVRVAGSLGALLSASLERASRGRERVDPLRRLLDAVQDARVATVDTTGGTIDEVARAETAIICDWATSDSVTQHAEAGSEWCSPRRLIDAMQRQGTLGADAHTRAIEALGNIQEDAGKDPVPSRPLLLRWNVAETLEEAGVLDILSRTRRIFLEAPYIESVRIELRDAATRERIASSITETLQRLRTGIADGSFVQTEGPPGESDLQLELRVVHALFSTDLPEAAFVIVDDRNLNGYRLRDDGKPIVSLWDVLRHLNDAGRMTDHRYFSIVAEMRRRGLMYIPIEVREIVWHVSQARVVDQALVPTEEMHVLERYVAVVLLDTEALYASRGEALGPGSSQMPYLFGLSQAIRGAIRQLLAEGSPDAEARATWVRRHLAVDGLPGHGISRFFGPNARDDATIDVEAAGLLGDYLTS
ncbi:MAG: serine protease [Rhodanobacter sp.]|nr:MAG: serine protease [Rhodanobacter sp.]